LVEIVVQGLHPTEEEIALTRDRKKSLEERRGSKTTLVTQEAERGSIEREDLPAGPLATLSDDLRQFSQLKRISHYSKKITTLFSSFFLNYLIKDHQ